MKFVQVHSRTLHCLVHALRIRYKGVDFYSRVSSPGEIGCCHLFLTLELLCKTDRNGDTGYENRNYHSTKKFNPKYC